MLVTRSSLLFTVGSIALVLGVTAMACGPDDTLPADDTTGAGNTVTSASAAQTTVAATTAASTSAKTSASTSVGGCQGLGDACSDCSYAQCEMQYCDCGENAACNALAACAGNCAAGDQQCSQNCLTMNQAGISDAIILSECTATQCAAACPTVARPDACQLCAAQSCPAQLNACVAEPQCLQIIACAEQCGPDDFVCLLGCQDDFGNGQDEAEALGGCVENVCPACQ